MRRRFQFRLRTLLILLVTVCIALGSWHLYFLYFGPYVEAVGPVVVGQPFTVRGRFVDFWGYESEVYAIQVSRIEKGGRVIHQSAGGSANRKGFWWYDVEVELSPVFKDGEFDVEIHPLTKAVAARKRNTPGDAVRGKMVVRRQADPQKPP